MANVSQNTDKKLNYTQSNLRAVYHGINATTKHVFCNFDGTATKENVKVSFKKLLEHKIWST